MQGDLELFCQLERPLRCGRFPVIGQLLAFLQHFLLIPLQTIRTRDQNMVVLQELPIGYEKFSQVGDLLYLVCEAFSFLVIVNPDEISVLQDN